MLEKSDFETIRALGLKFRGRSTWPQFRSYLPGFAPWMLTQDEAVYLTLVLDQACVVAERYRDRPEELGIQNALNDYKLFLVRNPPNPPATDWTDSMEPPAPLKEAPLATPPDAGRMEALKQGKRGSRVVDMDYCAVPTPIKGEEDDRPWFPQIVLCVDDRGGEIMHFDMVRRGELVQGLGNALLDLAEQMQELPKTVQVCQEPARDLLEPLTAGLGIKLKLVQSLPPIEEAQMGLLNSL